MKKDFIPATKEQLQQAAAGELILFAPARRHTAKLHAFRGTAAPKQSNRSCAADFVPILPALANELLAFPDAQLKSYPATDPTDCPDAHPWKDHYWVLDEPQTITREQLYSQAAMSAVAPAGKVEAGTAKTPAPVTQGNKLRRNNLDPAIDKAIKQAGNMELADVYLELKALAIDEEKPFIGAIVGDALCYTDDNNQPAKLTKDALGKRLKIRRYPPPSAVKGR